MDDSINSKKLWTKNFLCLISGNFLVQTASSAIAFVMSLFVLEISNSVFLYGLYLTMYYSTRIFAPVAFGPIIERNNKKTTYRICCLAFVLSYTIFLIMYISSLYNVIFTVLFSLISGLINAVYLVNENSFLVEIVDKDNIQKAYSINNAISYMSYVSQPLGTVVYKYIGINAILVISIVLFAIGLLLGNKTNILYENKENSNNNYLAELKDGLKFFINDKALFPMLLLVFFANIFILGIVDVIWLPYFIEYYDNGYLYYFICTAVLGAGVFHSSVLVYFLKVKKKILFVITFFSIIVSVILHVMVAVLPIVLMFIASYFGGLLDGTSDNLLSTEVLSTIDDKKKSQYIAMCTAAKNGGCIVGMIIATVLSEIISLKYISLICGLIVVTVMIIIFINSKSEIIKLYTRE